MLPRLLASTVFLTVDYWTIIHGVYCADAQGTLVPIMVG